MLSFIRQKTLSSVTRRVFPSMFTRNFSTVQQPKKLIESARVMPEIANFCGIDSSKIGTTVTVGMQSGGKSSLLESVIDEADIFPKFSGAATKRPLIINIVKTTKRDKVYVFGKYKNGAQITDPKVVQQIIQDENSGKFTKDPIELTIYQNKLPNMRIIDLPGAINTVKIGQDKKVIEIIDKMMKPYIDDSNVTKLLVMNGENDRANSKVLGEIIDSKQQDVTTGVITRIDKLLQVKRPNSNDEEMSFKSDEEFARSRIIDYLNDDEYLKHIDTVGVMLRSSQDLNNNVTVSQKIEEENAMIKKYKFREAGVSMGVETVRDILAQNYLRQSIDIIPQLRTALGEKKKQIESEKEMINHMSTSKTAIDEIAAASDLMYETLSTKSQERIELEKLMQKNMEFITGKEFTKSIAKYFPDFSPQTEKYTIVRDPQSTRYLNDLRKIYNSIGMFDNNEIDSTIKKSIGSFKYGKFTPRIDNQDFDNAYKAYLARSIRSQFYRFHLTEESDAKKRMWNNRLCWIVDDVIVNGKLAEKLLDSCIQTLHEGVIKLRPPNMSPVVAEFQNYIMNNMAERTQDDGLVDTLKRNIYKEKSPNSNFDDLGYYVSTSSYHIHDNWNEPLGLFGSETEWPRLYQIFGDNFTEAYFKDAIKRVGVDSHSVTNVDVSQVMLEKLLKISFQFFENRDFSKDSDRLHEKTIQLEEYEHFLNEIEPYALEFKRAHEHKKNAIEAENQQKVRKKYSYGEYNDDDNDY